MTGATRETLATTMAVLAIALLAWSAMRTPTRDTAPHVAPITSITPTAPAPR